LYPDPTGNLKALSCRSRSSTKGSSSLAGPEEPCVDHTDLVEREALWRALESDPEATRLPDPGSEHT